MCVCCRYLRSLHDGKLTRWEEKRLLTTATRMQALRRGNSARKEVGALKALRSTQDGKAHARKAELDVVGPPL